MSGWKKADLQGFYEDAARQHDIHDALARDIIKTLPEEEWPVWVRNRMRMWIDGPHVPIKLPNPVDPADERPGDLTFPTEWLSKVAAGLALPANYTPEDPYDIQGKMPLINAMQVHWWEMPPDQAEQVIVNAFRATMLSPRMNLKANAILYQLLMDVPAHESDPDVFEQKVRNIKAKWDSQGQGTLGQDPEDIPDPSQFLPGKLHSGFWGNIRRLAGLGPYIDDIYEAAMKDMQNGGTGKYFRQAVVGMNIPGVGMKVASFAWLALAPNTSDLGTIDVHMMRHLNQTAESPTTDKQYLQLEDQLRQEKDEMYGTEVPLSHYQWAVWDARRTPGFHQDHTPLKAYQPTPYQDIAWPPTAKPPRTRQPNVPEGQQSLLGKWVRMPAWKIYAANAYTIQGKVVAGVPGLSAQGTVVRPDRQSKDEIMEIINNLYTHQQDYQRQRQVIPEWALNRGGKVGADFQLGPGGTGYTYGGSVVCVSEWVDVNDNWLLEHPACRGIVAEKGGAASHGVVVARARNIAIVVDVPEAARIQPGDTVRLDSERAIIDVNGGSTEEFGEAQQAEIPIIRFIWSKGVGLTAPVPQDDPEGGTLHREMIMQQYRNGQWDMADNALGVVYPDGRVQMVGQPSDQEGMVKWLNTIHPITKIETGFQM